MNKRLNKRGYDIQRRILFEADDLLREMIKKLYRFYGFSTRNKVFPLIIFNAVFDVANTKEDKTWTPRQKHAWDLCKKYKEDFETALVIVAAKKVLKKEKKTALLTVKELGCKVKQEIQKCSHQKKK